MKLFYTKKEMQEQVNERLLSKLGGNNMEAVTVDILLDGNVVAENVSIEYCMIFARALLDSCNAESEMAVTIIKHIIAETKLWARLSDDKC